MDSIEEGEIVEVCESNGNETHNSQNYKSIISTGYIDKHSITERRDAALRRSPENEATSSDSDSRHWKRDRRWKDDRVRYDRRRDEERRRSFSPHNRRPREARADIVVVEDTSVKSDSHTASNIHKLSAESTNPSTAHSLREDAADDFEFALDEEDDEDRLINERRQKRMAILMRHESLRRDSGKTTPQSAVTPSTNSPRIDEVSVCLEKDDAVADATGISAADYDPNSDKQEDEQRNMWRHNHSAVDVPKKLAITTDQQTPSVAPVEDDMFAEDDMFCDAPIQPPSGQPQNTVLDLAPVVRHENPMLNDNWDDSEGYYRIILGEVLDDRYHVYANLGRGVFSAVVKAQDTKDGDKDVAIKIIRNNDVMHRAGLKEVNILNKLAEADPHDKKHLVRLHRSFEHKNHLCLVFESLHMNLREVLKKFGKDVGINIKAVRVYAHQLFLSLSLLGKCNILHSDIKPDNILVTESKSMLKLCDLGSASDTSENDITPYLVSRFYRAPEIILGLSYDPALDMWSVACTLYEMSTGQILFPGRSNNHMLRLIMDVKGKFPNKMLRRGQFMSNHFDEQLNFLQQERDKISGKDVIRKVSVIKPSNTIKQRLLTHESKMSQEELWYTTQFVDLLDKALNLAPDKRLTVKEALVHPFIIGKK